MTTNLDTPEVEICLGPECGDRGAHQLAKCPNACLAYVNNKMVVKASIERVQAKIKELQSLS